MMKAQWMHWIGPVLITGSLMLGAGCAAKQSDEHVAHRLANGDIQETTASVKTLPKFLNSQPTQMKDIYRMAADNADLLKWIPCYCGCGQSAGHQSNMNCFFKTVNPDGSIVWDDHGTKCDVCLNIAVQAFQMKQQGKSAKEIRAAIDQAYSKGYAAPTKTPLPS